MAGRSLGAVVALALLLLAGCAARVEAPAAAAAAPAEAQPTGPLAGQVIVLDPGHGNHTGEHSAAGNWEDDNVLAVAEDTAPLLTAMGATVHLTRTGPDLLGSQNNTDLTARVADAIRWHADVFVSIHENYFNGSQVATGVETFWANPNSKALAQDLQTAVAAGTGLQNRGVDSRPYWVIACNPMPAVLIEAGFLSNPAEAALISTPAFQEQEAQAIAGGLEMYLTTPGVPVDATPLRGENKYMCTSMNPVQANTWLLAMGE